MGSCINLDDIDTEIGMRFPIYVVVSVFLKSSSSTQTDSKSKIAMLVFGSLRKGYQTSQVCQPVFRGPDTRSSGTYVHIFHCKC